MRTKLYAAALVALAAAPACKWTEFDDLEGDTWVTATDKPNGDSTDYGMAMVRGQRTSAEGGKLVVLGSGQPQFTELLYSGNGDVDVAPTAQKLNSQFGVGNLSSQPLLVADPSSDDVALITTYSSTAILVASGTGGLKDNRIFGPEEPDAATYMLPPPNGTQPDPPSQVLVSAGDTVYGAYIRNPPNPQTKCQIVDEATPGVPLFVRGLGAVRNGTSTTDDVVVWGAPATGTTGKIAMYPGTVFGGCTPSQAPITGWTSATTDFAPGKGSLLVMVDSTHVLAVGHKELGNAESYLALFRIDPTAKTITKVGNTESLPDLRTAAIYDDGTKKFVVAGYPTATLDGVRSGQVTIYPLDLTSGLGSAAAVLHDAQPEEDQQFGRSVAVIPFNGKQTVAVGADNEIFMYFRTNVYGETRTGR